MKIYKYFLSWIPSIIIMVIIFSFSASVAKDSDRTSGAIMRKVVYVVEKITGETIDTDSGEYDKIHFFVRKTGHFLEYMALGFTLVLPYVVIFYKRPTFGVVLLFAEMTAALYACSDEFHQLFVEGRSGNIRDVLIDSIGAFVGIILGFIAYKIVEKLIRLRRS